MKKNQVFGLIIFALLIPFNSLHAQIGIPNDPELAKEAKKRTLIVVKDELSERQIKRLKKKDTYELIQNEYDKRNEKVLEMFQEHWHLNENIISKTESELKELVKSKSSEYVYVQLKYMVDTKKKKNMAGVEKTYRYSYFFFTIKLTDKAKTLGTVTTRGTILNDLEYLFAINTLQYFLDFVSEGNKRKNLEDEINKNATNLKEKTLLLPEYLTKLEINEIKEVYPYKIEIMGENEVINKINEKDSQYAYAYVNHKFGSCGTRYNHFVIDCGDYKPLLLDLRNKVQLGTSSQMTIFDDIATVKGLLGKDGSQITLFKQKFIQPKQLKNYTEIINGE